MSVSSPFIRRPIATSLLGVAVMLGGISDLFVETDPSAGTPGRRRAWLVTDRGPNGTTMVEGREHRTLAAPSFAPRILEARIDWDARHPRQLAVELTGTVPLCDLTGEAVSGRPNGLDNDPLIFDPQGRAAIAPDVDGVDTEGLVRTRDGMFWLAEEYRPSLLAEVLRDRAWRSAVAARRGCRRHAAATIRARGRDASRCGHRGR